MTEEYHGYTIQVTEFTGNLMSGDTDGLDMVASPRRYCELLRGLLAAEFPGSDITVTIQTAEGACPEARAYDPDGNRDDGVEDAIRAIEAELYQGDWYVENRWCPHCGRNDGQHEMGYSCS